MPSLFVVESPTKAKTIQKYLGAAYQVCATAGHFQDLPARELGVDLETLEPAYVVTETKAKGLARILAAAKSADAIYLATDPDREGEAIADQLAALIKRPRVVKRVLYTEVTKEAILEAIKKAGPIDRHLADAQKARRVLDRLFGYQVSPLLRAFGTNHSAGRVQSAALRLIVEREEERENFVARSFFVLTALYPGGLEASCALLEQTEDGGGSLKPRQFDTLAEAEAIRAKSLGRHVVTDVTTKPALRKPKPPFTTSALQQAAGVRFKFSPVATMAAAQALFEAGLISYHRTDSVAVAEAAQQMARNYLAKHHPEALPSKPPVYRSKASAQGAHEAIRPTDLEAELPSELADEARQLYGLIHQRFVASQCAPAELARTVVTLEAGGVHWRAIGEVLLKPSFLALGSGPDEDSDAGGEDAPKVKTWPKVAVGQVLDAQDVRLDARETKPPPRYTQPTLIRALEVRGVGRPSTYGTLVDDTGTLFKREYVVKEGTSIAPTPKGRLTDVMLLRAFAGLVQPEATATLESVLDAIAEGTKPWKEALSEWNASFQAQLRGAPGEFSVAHSQNPDWVAVDAPVVIAKNCPRCSALMMVRHGSKGAYFACTAFPTCEYRGNINNTPLEEPCPKCFGGMELIETKAGPAARCVAKGCDYFADRSPVVEEPCPKCSAPMKDRGTFLSCSTYPTCKGYLDKKGLMKSKRQGRDCPKCGKRLMPRKGKSGGFWGCSGYPACTHTEAMALPGAKPSTKSKKATEKRS